MADRKDILDKLLNSYKRYYDIHTEDVVEPFIAEAEFHTHGERYFLFRSAKLSSEDCHEYVYFASCPRVDCELFEKLDTEAWDRGMAKVEPGPDHRSSDVTLVILTDGVDEAVKKLVKKANHYKSYKNRVWGWSSYRLAVFDTSTGKVMYNQLGKSLKTVMNSL